jgi:uncharacterized protein with GYD domain
MSAYILLTKWTDQGIRDVKQAPDRIRQTEQLLQAHGARLTAWYLTMGEYDQVALVEAPDDEAMARIALSLGSRGDLRTTTLKAFTRDEFERMVAALG